MDNVIVRNEKKDLLDCLKGVWYWISLNGSKIKLRKLLVA